MGYRLRMPAEIGDWLGGLAGSEPEAAIEIGAALTALVGGRDEPGPPLVTGTEPQAAPGQDADPRELLDSQYQQLLEGQGHLRRELADVANQQWRLQAQLEVAGLDPAMRAALEHQLAAADELEPLLSERASRLQRLVETIRTEKETAKAVITAAEARARIDEVASELIRHEGIRPAEPARRPGLADESGPDSEAAASERKARLERLVAQARQLLDIEGRDDPGATAPHATGQSRARVRELNADRLGSGARLLFAFEPADTIALLTVLESAAAVAVHREAAIDAAAELLDEIGQGDWPPGDGEILEFGDTDEFLTRFFPQARADVLARAAALAELTSLATLRAAQNLSVAELADRAGLPPGKAASAETDLPSASIGQVAAYVRGLGGTLRLTVTLDGERQRIT